MCLFNSAADVVLFRVNRIHLILLMNAVNYLIG